ncbi:MAG: xanthine dehydrogenase family protein subunit M, partial [Caldiserica bacterium]
MIIAHEFEYFKPSSIDEAIKLLNKYGAKARILSGGTDLVVRIKDGFETPDAVIDIKGLDELKVLDFKDNKLIVGTLTTFNELIDSEVVKEKFPLLWESAKTVASMGIRNRATMVGNICSAVPSLDSGPALLLYEATVVVKGKDGERRIPIEEWFLGPRKTALKEGELVEYIEIPL